MFNSAVFALHLCLVSSDLYINQYQVQTPFFSPPWDNEGDAKPPGD